MLHALTRSVKLGARRSIAAMSGCLTAMVLVLLASAAGLSAVLVASPLAFETIRYAGVGYLLYLGVKAWRGGDTLDVSGSTTMPATPSLVALFRGGFLIAIGNPKLLLFAAAFLPQFVNQAAPRLPQFAILIGTFGGIEAFWYAVYGLGGQTLAHYLVRPRLVRWFNRVTGGLFVGFGAALLRARL